MCKKITEKSVLIFTNQVYYSAEKLYKIEKYW